MANRKKKEKVTQKNFQLYKRNEEDTLISLSGDDIKNVTCNGRLLLIFFFFIAMI